MAFCPNCGSELREGTKFCENCGAPVAVPVKEAAFEQPVYEQPVYEQPVYEQPVYDQSAVVGNNAEQNSAAKSALIMSIVGLVLAEFGIPGIIVSAIAKGKVKKAMSLGAVGGKVKVAKILSTVGLILSIVMTIVWFLYLIVIGAVAAYGVSSGEFDDIFSYAGRVL